MNEEFFSRSAALLGEEQMHRLQTTHFILVGVGGVGSWCAEALVRTGATHLTIIDDDRIAPSNVNRQCPAIATTLSLPKAEVMKARLMAINPEAELNAVIERYQNGVPARFSEGERTVIIDAIDSVDCKAQLILWATENSVPIISSMGAAGRLDPTKVEVKRFDKVTGDGLARALRQHFKRLGRYPAAKFECAVSSENSMPMKTVRPSYMPVTCAFGMALAARAMLLSFLM